MMGLGEYACQMISIVSRFFFHFTDVQTIYRYKLWEKVKGLLKCKVVARDQWLARCTDER